MAGLRETKEMILLAYADGFIGGEEFVLLWDINKLKTLDFPYLSHGRFDLGKLIDDDCWAYFRFMKNDMIFSCRPRS